MEAIFAALSDCTADDGHSIIASSSEQLQCTSGIYRDVIDRQCGVSVPEDSIFF
jgi:hypothetical protein